MADPVSKAQIGERFATHIENLAESATNVYESQAKGVQRRWAKFWDKEIAAKAPNDIYGLRELFSRNENAQHVFDAAADASAPGVVGDLIVSSLQGDYLACQERALRLRFLRVIHARYEAVSRRRGHGHEAGLFRRGVLGYVQNILKASKVEPPGEA